MNGAIKRSDVGLAVALARLGLGVNIALHGWTRVFKFREFSAHLEKQFANSILPLPLIDASAYGIAGCECIVGLLLIAGLALRFALSAGSVLMIVLLFGTCLIQDWSTAGDQLIYLAYYAALLALCGMDRWSLNRRGVPARAITLDGS
jgi:thiosulfate dehydrogenase [quinone] large subunit